MSFLAGRSLGMTNAIGTGGLMFDRLPEEIALSKLQQQKMMLEYERDIARRKAEANERAGQLRKEIEALGATPCA